MSAFAKMMERVEVNANGCWIWKGANVGGYGVMMFGGKRYVTHRLAYESRVGELIPGLVIDHLCAVKSCCNPAHLEQVSYAQNSTRAVRMWGGTASRELWLKQLRNSADIRIARTANDQHAIARLEKIRKALREQRATLKEANRLVKLDGSKHKPITNK